MRSRLMGNCFVLACACVLGVAGCGTPGAPEPPSLNLPAAVADLSATRTGNTVFLSWTMPLKNTDKLMLKSDVSVRVCRTQDNSGCIEAGTVPFAPGADATWSETLPQALEQGAPRKLRYCVELKNRAGRSAGLSNEAIVLAGAPPTPVEGLSVEMRKQGAMVHWSSSDDTAAIRLHRKLLSPPPAKTKESLMTAPSAPLEQSLLIENVQQGQALDKTIRFGETYEYRAQRVARVTIDGKKMELSGELSAPVQVEARDVFPPTVPIGLVAVPTRAENGNSAAIDLSWEPDAEADIAGYIVYRREGDGAWQRISPPEPVVGPAFHDAQVQPGHQYRYAVAAVDQGGHESARSIEAEESAPND